MNISEQIRNYRKSVGLTQEQVANALGVSASAVNKWEKGNSYPDISTLPALARLLQMDMNELFSFREELTDREIGQFVNELSEAVLEESIDTVFEMASKKIHEYPRCELLIYTVATVLNSALILSQTAKGGGNTMPVFLAGLSGRQKARMKRSECPVSICWL